MVEESVDCDNGQKLMNVSSMTRTVEVSGSDSGMRKRRRETRREREC